MSQLAELTVSGDRDVLVASVRGELDMSNVDDVELQIIGSVPNTALGLVLDLAETTYLDSSGVKLVFQLSDRLQVRQQVLCLAVPKDGPVRRLLHMVGAEEALNVRESVDAADDVVRAGGDLSAVP